MTPDVLVAAKAVSSGYAPVAAMIVREHIYEAFGDAVPSPSVQSYGGHGASAAAGARAFEVYETERMDEVAERRGAELEARLAHLRDHPLVRDIRRIGLWIAIELQDPATGESLARGLQGTLGGRARCSAGCCSPTAVRRPRMSEGLLHIAPPLVATDSDFDFIADRIPPGPRRRGPGRSPHSRDRPDRPNPSEGDDMRLAALGLLHETNTFAPNLTGPDDFPLMPVGADQSSIVGIITGEQLWNVHAGAKTTLAGFHDADSLAGVDVVPLVFATTPPSGTISRDAFEKVARHILEALDAEGPFDGVLMAQHGASVAEDFPDADAEMIRAGPGRGRSRRPDRRGGRHPRQHLARPARAGDRHAGLADQPARRLPRSAACAALS